MIQRISEVLMSDNTVCNQMCRSGNVGMYILIGIAAANGIRYII
jgi:hypothetical protein